MKAELNKFLLFCLKTLILTEKIFKNNEIAKVKMYISCSMYNIGSSHIQFWLLYT